MQLVLVIMEKAMMHAEELIEYIKIPKWDRIFRIKDALMAGCIV